MSSSKQRLDEKQVNELISLYMGGKLQEADTVCRDLARQYPRTPFLHNMLGLIRMALGHGKEAITHYQTALTLKPDYIEVYINLGAALNSLGSFQEAITCYRKALTFNPDYADAYNGLGITLGRLGRQEESVASYRRALSLNPENEAAYNNLGIALTDLGRYAEAVSNLQKALALNPDNVKAYYNCGNALMRLGRHEEAAASFRKALDIDSEYILACCSWLNELAHICALDDLQRAVQDELHSLQFGTEAKSVASPFLLLSLIDDPDLHRRAAEAYASVHFKFNPSLPPLPDRTAGERIRIGYFSADFHNHATMYLMAGLFEKHDSSRFEIHAFSFGPDQQDEMRARLLDNVEYFHDVRQQGHAEIATLARELGIDIAVDLKGYTQHGRPGIFAYRVAPIQVNYLGYPGTMGAPYIDYIIADPIVIPCEYHAFYSEKVACLPDCYQVNDRYREVSNTPVSRADHNLPETAFVFCCFNNSYKIMPEEFSLWMHLLDQVDGSVLWLLKTNPAAERNLRDAAGKQGVDADRLIFAERVPFAEHMARQGLADLFLDTFIYNAHTTASDALWGGLPVLTMMGRSFASRVAGSILSAADLPELITTTATDYQATALRLATHPLELQAIKDKLTGNLVTSALFDTERYTRNLEAIYAHMYKRHNDGLEPEHFSL